jgi:hypothetical protein
MLQIFYTSLSAHLCDLSNEAALPSIPIIRYSKMSVILHKKKRGGDHFYNFLTLFLGIMPDILLIKVKKAA